MIEQLSFPSLMPAAFEDNKLVIPPLNKIGSWLCLGKRLTCHENILIIALLIAIKKGGGTAKRNASFDHCKILLSILYENADHAYHPIHTTTVNRTEENRA